MNVLNSVDTTASSLPFNLGAVKTVPSSNDENTRNGKSENIVLPNGTLLFAHGVAPLQQLIFVHTARIFLGRYMTRSTPKWV